MKIVFAEPMRLRPASEGVRDANDGRFAQALAEFGGTTDAATEEMPSATPPIEERVEKQHLVFAPSIEPFARRDTERHDTDGEARPAMMVSGLQPPPGRAIASDAATRRTDAVPVATASTLIARPGEGAARAVPSPPVEGPLLAPTNVDRRGAEAWDLERLDPATPISRMTVQEDAPPAATGLKVVTRTQPQMAGDVRTQTVPTRLDLVLEPERLGTVKVTLVNTAGGVRVELVAATREGFDALRKQRELLAPVLRELRGGEVRVQVVLQTEANAGTNGGSNASTVTWHTETWQHAATDEQRGHAAQDQREPMRDAGRDGPRDSWRDSGRDPSRDGSRDPSHERRREMPDRRLAHHGPDDPEDWRM